MVCYLKQKNPIWCNWERSGRDVSKNLTQFVSNLLHECKLFCMLAKHKYVCIKKCQLRERRSADVWSEHDEDLNTGTGTYTKVTHLTSTPNRFCWQIQPDTKMCTHSPKRCDSWRKKFCSHLRYQFFNDRRPGALRYFQFSTHICTNSWNRRKHTC